LWVIERALAARSVSRALVATDDARIFDCVTSGGFEAVMTRERHATGTDRVAKSRAISTPRSLSMFRETSR